MSNRSPSSARGDDTHGQGHLGESVSVLSSTHKQCTPGLSTIMKGSLSQYGRNYYIEPGPAPRFPELQTYPFDEAPYRIPCLKERHLSRGDFQDVRKEYKEFFSRWDPVFRKRNGKGRLRSSEKLMIEYPNWAQDNCTEEQYAYWCCYWNHSGWM